MVLNSTFQYTYVFSVYGRAGACPAVELPPLMMTLRRPTLLGAGR